MFNNTALDVFIGLAFVYLLYSLFATVINEAIASIFGLRAKMLKHAILRMLSDSATGKAESNSLYTSFFQHALIKYLGKGEGAAPSYLAPATFSKAVVDILGNAAAPLEAVTAEHVKTALEGIAAATGAPIIPADTGKVLQSYFAEANGDLAKFRALLEQWFDDTMNRASGWYKRQTQLIVFFIGVVLAVGFNVDTLQIEKRLSTDKVTRDALAQQAVSYVKTHQRPADPTAADSVPHPGSIQEVDSMIVVVDSVYKADVKGVNALLGLSWSADPDLTKDNMLWKCLGWLITAVAISLGAPFWFDTLSMLIKLRGTGPTEDEKKKSKSKPPSST